MSFDVVSRVKQSPPVDVSKAYDATSLQNKNILITGGANGLGSHMVHRWASHGANIAIADIDDPAGEALVAQLRKDYPKATFIYQHCNVTEWESQVELFDVATASLPGKVLDIVVPNAGILLTGAASAFENPQMVDGKLRKPSTRVFDVNITGVWYTTHLALYHLPLNTRPGGDRCILLLGSLASLMNFTGQAQYTASKHAILGLFRTLRGTASLVHDIRVNMICPYYVNGSRLLPTAAEAVLLAGGAPEGGTAADDVIDAATRLIADQSIRGRGLAIGPRVKEVPDEFQTEVTGVIPPISREEYQAGGRAVWEIYADDYRAVDTWVWRYINILNALTVGRGYFRWFKDAFVMWNRK